MTNSFDFFLICWAGLAAVVFLILFFLSAPYGRFTRSGWGPKMSQKWGWILMELISPLTLLWTYFFYHGNLGDAGILIALALWVFHYFNRSIIFPLKMKKSANQMPVLIVLFSAVFNGINGFTNGYWFAMSEGIDFGITFWIGLLLFAFGYYLNVQSDQILVSLRQPGETAYKIPYGGFYKWVSCPNYMGEIIEWLGFALLTRSPAALVFWIWTFANLFPRALTIHKWYLQKFHDYPKERQAIFPKLF